MAEPSASIQEAAHRLREGGVVAFPTETVYGLGADALNAAAVQRVYELKGRPSRNPLIVHVSGPEMAASLVTHWTDEADALARAFWPGPLSIILPKTPIVPDIVTGGGPSVAIRCPDHPTALALLFEFSRPIVGPSANLSGSVSPTRASHVRDAFSPDDVLVLEGGACTVGIESTVVTLVGPGAPRILRLGAIGPDDIAAVLKLPTRDWFKDRPPPPAGQTTDTAPLASPGLLDRHYAPRTPARLFSDAEWPAIIATPTPFVIITHRLRDVPAPHHVIEMPPAADAYAAHLYAALRDADTLQAASIFIEQPPDDSALWQAIADRLRRATTA